MVTVADPRGWSSEGETLKKQLTIGTHQVTVEILRAKNEVLNFTATCGQSVRRSTLSARGPHDHPIEQATKDIDDFVTKLANEVAGAEQARLNLDSIFGEEVPDAT